MIHPSTRVQFINEEVGNGLVATRFIPKGTITWVMDPLDRTITQEEFNNLPALFKEILDIYTFRNNKGNHILCWDNGKYVNHSFKSNCLTTAYDFEIAIRDIQPGEQLTDDYGYLNISKPFKGADEGTNRKYVYPDDLVRYFQAWDDMLKQVFPLIIDTTQPLWKYLPKTTISNIQNVMTGNVELASIFENYYDQNTIKH